MKTVTNSNPKTDQKSPKPTLQAQQASTFLDEADYYDYEAELAQEKSDYYHLRYGY
ncbi:hypothetical protein LC653_34915 [Nostoc sp. CHAB 5784]|uniref:hypothetical protein n=1 Tax=Nostoc mirabile TaxID=2907820 RepID=UPI001E5F03BB|nr:hypothetical protein [Nostoc mirabile]MCC5668911.1 hypothetical protein [Nostoc mirabile CHAB5784]